MESNVHFKEITLAAVQAFKKVGLRRQVEGSTDKLTLVVSVETGTWVFRSYSFFFTLF